MGNEPTNLKFEYVTDTKNGPIDSVMLDTKGAVIQFATKGRKEARAKSCKTTDVTIVGSVEKNKIEIVAMRSNIMLIVDMNDIVDILTEMHRVANNLAMSEERGS